MYQTQDMERNTMHKKYSLEQFNYMVHIKRDDWSAFVYPNDNCSWYINAHISNKITVNDCFKFVYPTRLMFHVETDIFVLV